MSAIVSGIAGAVITTVLVTIAERTQRVATRDGGGWKRLYPSWLLNALFIGSAAFSVAMVYFIGTGGSTLPDAERQNFFAALLAITVIAMTIYVGWGNYCRTISWGHGKLRVRNIFGRERSQALSSVRSLRKIDTSGEYQIVFSDGSRLRYSAYLHGAGELAAKLSNKRKRA